VVRPVIWLVRHGEPDWPGGALGWSDPPLTAAGRAQASAAAARLESRPLGAVHASDLRRAAETAALVAAPHRLPVRLSADLRELSFGRWEGRDLAALWQEQPEAAREWEADLHRTPADFGESLADLERRVACFAAGLGRPAGDVAVVAHRGSLAVLQSLLTGADLAGVWRLGFALAEVRPLEVWC
jgi:broad specificity phosphatase PhoE